MQYHSGTGGIGMEKINGKSIFNGIAVGKILFYSKDAGQVKRVKITDTRAEMERYKDRKSVV